MTVQQHIQNQLIRETSLYRINPDGSSGYVVNGEIIERKKFEAMYPLKDVFTRARGATCDGTKKWLRND